AAAHGGAAAEVAARTPDRDAGAEMRRAREAEGQRRRAADCAEAARRSAAGGGEARRAGGAAHHEEEGQRRATGPRPDGTGVAAARAAALRAGRDGARMPIVPRDAEAPGGSGRA